jgi:predicted DNA binding protein
LLKRHTLVALLLILAQLFGATAICEEASDVERLVISAFINQFTKLIQWPNKKDDFIIYVIEDEALTKVLADTMADKTVGSRKIDVMQSNWVDVVLKQGDMVIFPKKETNYHRAVITKLKDKPCLVVGFTEGLGAAGATINFFLSDNKIKFELNMKSAKAKSLQVDPRIMKLAKLIE